MEKNKKIKKVKKYINRRPKLLAIKGVGPWTVDMFGTHSQTSSPYRLLHSNCTQTLAFENFAGGTHSQMNSLQGRCVVKIKNSLQGRCVVNMKSSLQGRCVVNIKNSLQGRCVVNMKNSLQGRCGSLQGLCIVNILDMRCSKYTRYAV